MLFLLTKYVTLDKYLEIFRSQLPYQKKEDIGINRGIRWHRVKESACQCRRCKRCRFDPWVGKIPRSRKWKLTPVLLPGKFHGQRSPVDYSPWDRKESDMTERLSTHTHTQECYIDHVRKM